MRILFFDNKLPPLLRDQEAPAGGASVQILALIGALNRAGHVTGVLAYKGANDLAGSQQLCELIETYDPNRGFPMLRLLVNVIPSLLAGARAFNPDVIVQSSLGRQTGFMAFVARRLRVPFVHRLAADIDSDGRSLKALSWRDRFAIRYGLARADLVICQNAYQRDSIMRRYPGKRVLQLQNVLPLPIDSSRLRSRSERGYVAWAGIFRRVKNLGLLREIAQALPDIAFRIAGMPVANLDRETATALAELEKLPNVRIMGYLKRSEVHEFMSGAVAILCTSDHEGFPNTFLEALVAGTPVVTRTGVDPDSFIERNALGRVAPNERLAVSIREIWNLDATAFDALAGRGQRYIAENHLPQLLVEKLVAEIRTLRAP